MKVSSLPERAGRVYELWLVDNETGDDLNLGVFDTDNDGEGKLNLKRTMNNPARYDRIIVTSEDSDDQDPRRDGPIVLTGKQK
jgi:hypothetical protein